MKKASNKPIVSTMQSAKQNFPSTGIASSSGNKSMAEKAYPGTKPSAVKVQSEYVTDGLVNPVKK